MHPGVDGGHPSRRDRHGVRRAFLAALVMNTVIVVSGGAVRLTDSGLGCPTFPRCTDDSFIATREMGLHGFIEFGNRMLTFAVAAAVVIALVTAVRAGRADLVRLGWLLVIGIAAQALLGGITVLTSLNPVTVMAHFLVSMALIAVAVVAHDRSTRPAPGQGLRGAHVVRREVLVGARVLVAVVSAVIFVGTVVTGSGPHSGDKQAADRLPFDLIMVTQLHADLVFLLLGLLAGLLIALRVCNAPAYMVGRGVVLGAVVFAQGAIGYLQYATGLPVIVVGAHVLGACLVWIAALRFALAVHDREVLAVHDREVLAVHDREVLAVHDREVLAVHDREERADEDTPDVAVRTGAAGRAQPSRTAASSS